MTTTTRPSTSTEHADEARRLLSLIGPAGLNEDQFHETLAYARDPQAIAAAAQVHATLALVEEQRTANLIAADTTDQLSNPYQVGTREHDAYWKAHTDALAERLAVQR